jgi:hypothetical protein
MKRGSRPIYAAMVVGAWLVGAAAYTLASSTNAALVQCRACPGEPAMLATGAIAVVVMLGAAILSLWAMTGYWLAARFERGL